MVCKAPSPEGHVVSWLLSCRSHDCLKANARGYYGMEHAAALPGRRILAAAHEVRAKDSTDSTETEIYTMCVYTGALLSVSASFQGQHLSSKCGIMQNI